MQMNLMDTMKRQKTRGGLLGEALAVPTAVSLPAGQVSGGRPSPSIGLPGGHVLSTSRRAGHLVRCVLAASCCQLVTSRHSAPYPEPIPAERPSPATCLTRAGEDHLQLAGVRENARDVIGRYRCRWRARFVSRAPTPEHPVTGDPRRHLGLAVSPRTGPDRRRDPTPTPVATPVDR